MAVIVSILLYAAVVWWLRDGGRTPVLAITMHKLGGACKVLALDLAALGFDLQRGAHTLIKAKGMS